MPTMKREIFLRPTRMTHKFGATERVNDPLGDSTFDFKPPVFPAQRSGAVDVHAHGEHRVFDRARSPVEKFVGGAATLEGPAPSWAENLAAPIPARTKKRANHRKTDK